MAPCLGTVSGPGSPLGGSPVWASDGIWHFHTFKSTLGAGVCLLCCNLSSRYRIALAFTGISLLVVGTTMVGYLPNGR